MKAILFALTVIVAVTSAAVPVTRHHQNLLGAKKCTQGPSYWCQDLQASKQCNATQHCIKTQWESLKVPEDNDSVCDICKKMVKEARDQLESNQTQDELKQVFEGSCKLMIAKPIVEVCDKLVDEFIPELVETLASQMDPSVVCSVSGLCNSEKIDQLIAEHEAKKKTMNKSPIPSLENDELKPDSCSGCYTIATHLTDKFKKQSKDTFLNNLLGVCGQMGSFSDGCSSLVIINFNEIHSQLDKELTAENVCHLSGQCAGLYHKHENETGISVEIRPLSTVGIVDIGDDLPCKLCEQLVGHLRDLLVANTTEIEFKEILEGMCKQTKSFSSECKSLVDEYYSIIYETLTKKLNGNAVCTMASICPSPDKKKIDTTPYMPLLPPKSIQVGGQLFNQKKQKNLGEHGSGVRQSEAEQMQLPLERFDSVLSGISMPNMDVEGQKTCAFCEYLLHFVQKEITDPEVEGEVKRVLDKVCDDLPQSLSGTCKEFLDTYEDAIISLFAQEIDPSQLCPQLHVCPSASAINMWKNIPKDLMIESEVKDKPSCPLCLLAVEQLEKVIKDDKTEENIERQLNKLCSHLPSDLNEQCEGFIKSYSKELIEMLIADLTPQEICVYAKLCDPNTNSGPSFSLYPLDQDGEIMTNEIPDYPVVEKKTNIKDDGKCVACEFIMQYIEKAMRNKSTKDEIEKIVHGVCNHLPKTVSKECNDFVNQYADIVIDMLSQEVSPKEVCTMIGLCQPNIQRMIDSVAECALCQALISSIDTMLTDPTVDHDIEEVVGKACNYIAPSKQEKCNMLLEVYEKSIINLLKRGVNTKKICTMLTLCSSEDFYVMTNVRSQDGRLDNIRNKKRSWNKSPVLDELEATA